MLKNKTFIAVFIKCLLMPINAGTMLYKGRISYLLVLNQRWAVRGSRAFYIKKSEASTTDSTMKDVTSDLLRALVTESSANQILTFNDSLPSESSYVPSATPCVKPPL